MKLLKEKIRQEGVALSDSILKVDSFINHQVDPDLMRQIGEDFAEHFKDQGITKVFTIESSGIAPAVYTAMSLNVPMVILKKQTSKILQTDVWQTEVLSYTKNIRYDLTLAKNYVNKKDQILIIDDFLASGEAAAAAIRLTEQAGATVAGIGILIEKSFQSGRGRLEELGFEVYSQARISRLAKDTIEFADD